MRAPLKSTAFKQVFSTLSRMSGPLSCRALREDWTADAGLASPHHGCESERSPFSAAISSPSEHQRVLRVATATLPSCRRASAPPAWRWSRRPCTFMTEVNPLHVRRDLALPLGLSAQQGMDAPIAIGRQVGDEHLDRGQPFGIGGWARFSMEARPRRRLFVVRSGSREESVRALARRYRVSPTMVQKWRKRTSTADAPMGPKEPRSTVITPPCS
ncbi:hypothetical protein OCOJLMKI_4993 [Methylobacterium iners]|uniref:Transposase n=1 Tax=Methylobacterium iners TaxID=418707 RepID=A0ABQ4S3Q7_9HYPH|nr:hypothetical protein OCOJLMKI_4993 [Methylobacterium iners]